MSSAVISNKGQKTGIRSFEDYKKDVLSSKESARKFMSESGIITRSGKLAASYK